MPCSVSKEEFLNIVLRRVKAVDDDSDDDDAEDDDDMRADTEQAKREIEGIRNEGEKIFDRIWKQNEMKITLTQIRQYMRKAAEDMLKVDRVVFMRHRLQRHIRMNKLGDDAAAAPELTLELFEQILKVDESEFGDNMAAPKGAGGAPVKASLRNEDDVPLITNPGEVLEQLKRVFSASEDTDISKRELSVVDAHNLLLIGVEMRSRILYEIRSRGQDLELTQDQFTKTMEKKMYDQSVHNVDNVDYSRPYDEWTAVARQSACVFQQVKDEEQGKVTLGQVRETLRFIHRDIRALTKNMSKFKKKLSKLKKRDQMVELSVHSPLMHTL